MIFFKRKITKFCIIPSNLISSQKMHTIFIWLSLPIFFICTNREIVNYKSINWNDCNPWISTTNGYMFSCSIPLLQPVIAKQYIYFYFSDFNSNASNHESYSFISLAKNQTKILSSYQNLTTPPTSIFLFN